MSKLDAEELQILKAFEKGRIKRSKNAAETRKKHQEYAEAMFGKDARISIRFLPKIFVDYKKGRWRKAYRIKH